MHAYLLALRTAMLTTSMADELDTDHNLCYVSDMPWPESRPVRGEDVAFAASAATIKDSTSVGRP